MGESDVVLGIEDTTNCFYMSRRKDCDGDWDNYCNTSKPCPYKRRVRDCDGDWIFMCIK